MGAADRAFRIFMQFQFAKTHGQRIDQQQPPDQRLSRTEDQLDDFRRLNDSQQARQNSQHPAFRTRRNKSRRWRLRIQAAIARTFLSAEHARLPFKTKDRGIRVRLSRQHARIVHQVPRWEIVSAVRDDVEILEDLQRVFTAESSGKFHNIYIGIDGFQRVFRRVELRTPNVAGPVNHLALPGTRSTAPPARRHRYTELSRPSASVGPLRRPLAESDAANTAPSLPASIVSSN